MSQLHRQVLAVILVSGSALGIWAAEPAAVPEGERNQRLKHMQDLIDEAVLVVNDPQPQELTRTEHPILRYTNPVTSAFGEGTLFLWLQGKRPMAAVSPSFRDNGATWWELSSLADHSLKLTRAGQVVWQPPVCNRKSDVLPGAPLPAQTAAARLIQLRALARRFHMREERRGQWQDGRLLSQPLYRWEDLTAGILDGGLFGFAETTDPELLLLIEARLDQSSKQATWYYALAKMTSSPVTLSLDGKQVWAGSGYWRNPRSPQDPYVEAIAIPASQPAATLVP